jgi:hypothetical protein
MKSYNRLFLGLTLVFLLFGLAGHLIPSQGCCCFEDNTGDFQGFSGDNAETEPCIICQLQTGVHFQTAPSFTAVEKIDLENSLDLHRIDHSRQISRPPILI